MPHAFYSRVFAEATGTKLGAPNSYGAGIVFTPKSDAAVAAIKEIFEAQAKQRGLKVLGWRSVQTDNSAIGTTAKSTEPRMEQVKTRRAVLVFPATTNRCPAPPASTGVRGEHQGPAFQGL